MVTTMDHCRRRGVLVLVLVPCDVVTTRHHHAGGDVATTTQSSSSSSVSAGCLVSKIDKIQYTKNPPSYWGFTVAVVARRGGSWSSWW